MVHSFQDLSRAYIQSQKAFDTKFFILYKNVFYHQPEVKKEHGEQLEKATSYISEMKNLLPEARYEQFLERQTEWQHFMSETHCIEEKGLKKINKGFLFIFTDNEEYFQSGNDIDEVETFDELCGLFFQIVNERVRNKESEMGNFSPITKHILAYLESNYKDEISLKYLSLHYMNSLRYKKFIYIYDIK